MSPPRPPPAAPPPAWAPNPYSALALYPPHATRLEPSTPLPASRFPWWLNPLTCLAVAFILFYRNVIPHGWKRQCIYTPTCSMYGLTSLKKYGLLRGSARTWSRIHRCNATLFQEGHDAP